jgi:hypothetical protein
MSVSAKNGNGWPHAGACIASALGFLVLAPACDSIPPRVPFNPTSGPPECVGKPGEFATAEWDAFHSNVERIAKAMHFDEKDPTLVRQQLDVAVRTLADRDGCVVGGTHGQPGGYRLSCGTLPPEKERERADLERVLRDDFPAATQSAKSYADKCGVAFLALPWTSGLRIGSAPVSGADAGCNFQSTVDVCQRGCDNGNADACNAVSGNTTADPAAKTEARECEIRLRTKGDPQISSVCSSAIYAQLGVVANGTPMGVGGTKERAQKLLAAACAAEPTGSACTSLSGKIDVLSLPLRPRLAPGGGFYCTGWPTDPPARMTCGRDDCVQTAASLSKTIPGCTCVQRSSASCFSSVTSTGAPGTSCSGGMSRCLELLSEFKKSGTFQITDRCKETQ